MPQLPNEQYPLSTSRPRPDHVLGSTEWPPECWAKSVQVQEMKRFSEILDVWQCKIICFAGSNPDLLTQMSSVIY
jgi:hypothetical protein